MSNTSNKPVLIILIVVLLITNLGMLWYFTRDAKEEVKPMTRSERMGEMMRKELNFDDRQVQEYLALRARRDSIMAPLNLELRAAKMEMLDLISKGEGTDSLLWLGAEKVAAKQVPIEVAFHQHFKRLQAICNQQQLKSFDSMLQRMVRRSTGDTTVNR
jgi:protein CpxP